MYRLSAGRASLRWRALTLIWPPSVRASGDRLGQLVTLPTSMLGVTYTQQLEDYAASLRWVRGLIVETMVGDLDRPTPCSTWDVRQLIGHLIGTAYRGRGTAAGASTAAIPHVVTNVADDKVGEVYAQLADEIVAGFAAVDCGTVVRAPWGDATALEAVIGLTVETVTHGWDLAMATDRPAAAPPGVAERCFAVAADVIPARLRGVMYGDPVADDARISSTERLARLLGRR